MTAIPAGAVPSTAVPSTAGPAGAGAAGAGPAGAGPATAPGIGEILFVELLGGIGDLLIALPAIHLLADSHPRARLRVLTFTPAVELLHGDPRVAEILPLTDHGGRAVQAAVRDAMARRPDLAVTTTRHSGVPAAIESGRPRFAVTDLWRGPGPHEPIGDRYVRLLAADGWLRLPDGADRPAGGRREPDQLGERPPGQVALDSGELTEGRHRLVALTTPGGTTPGGTTPGGTASGTAGGGVPVLLVPDAGMAVKRWPAPRWAELARLLTARGHPLLHPHGTAVPRAVAVPPLSLREFAGLCAAVAERGGVVVGGDTGPVRLAAAVGAPTVTLFGPSTAARYGLVGQDGSATRTRLADRRLAGGTAGTDARRPRRTLGADLQGLPDCAVRRPLAITEQECWWTARCPLAPDGPACLDDLSAEQVAGAVAEVARTPPTV
ncbi:MULTISPECIES: glycosyltransferase family 9 protein [Frankia]|uniref:Glycosyl transferase putative signal peptide n=1 Tax=Frankia alni (strain DSM 45986 / CECT 9034 / ACN14a) TaxID=326424 RepID=Q0RIU1_FRAAA|nr:MULTISPECIES: glycosyltransferase family 9 protein [Frankia]CAJ62574.1 Putative glycosyl transferase; putative signal peptide [Frankia alni ACN14a]